MKVPSVRAGFARTALAVAVLALSSATSRADDAPTVEDVDQRLKVLERKLEIQAEEAAAKAKDTATTTIGEKGFSWKSADGAYELKLRGLVQADWRTFMNDSGATFNDTFVLRRLRPTFEGTLGKLVAFRLAPEFAGSGATLVDAYVDLRFHPAATVRAGKVKGPVGLERLQSGAATSFIERGFPTELAPNRDIGVQLQGEVAAGALQYTVGLFNGTADGRDAAATDVDNRKEVAARLFSEPFRQSPGFFQNLGVGIAGSHGLKSGSSAGSGGVLPQYRTHGQNVFFQYAGAAAGPPALGAVTAAGAHTRLSPQAYWYRNRFGLLTEYIVSSQEVSRSGVAGEQEFDHKAWQAVTGFVVTGEDASFRGATRPKSPWTVDGPGWGAVELVARYGQLDVDDDAFTTGFASASSSASKATAYGAGVNWYLTPNAKVVLDYNHTSFDGGAAGGADRETEQALFTRLQLAY